MQIDNSNFTTPEKDIEKTVCQNLPLVHSIVKRFLNRGAEYEDLYQIGCIGLINAAKRFNEELGFQFSTYATSLIMGEIRRYLRDDGIIKVSRHLKEVSYKANTFSKSFTLKHGREPTICELSKLCSVPAEEIAAAYEALRAPASLSAENDDGISLMDTFVSPENQTEKLINNIVIKKTISRLSEREQKIIMYRYFKDKTQKETADLIGISQVQVSRIEKKLLQKMRKEFLQ